MAIDIAEFLGHMFADSEMAGPPKAATEPPSSDRQIKLFLLGGRCETLWDTYKCVD